ncbi:MAG: hypothetical protein FWH26_07160 [Oscillospiraceae bacterium]|nr:hypothetical protein [Oscillospiraceae bacterium]
MMRYSKKWLPLCVLTACVLLITTINLRRAPPAGDHPPTSEFTQPYQYLLREEGGDSLVIYLMENGAPEKLASLPAALDDLPLADRRDLARGIALRDSDQLQRALEDYIN